MDSTPSSQPTPKKPSSTLNWAILVVILVVAVAGAIYAVTRNTSTSNSNDNTNVVLNQNTNVVANSNTVLNTNTVANANSTINSNANAANNSNTNTSVSTAGWKTYENSAWKFSFKYPKEWTFIRDLLPKTTKDGTSPTENLLIGLPIADNQDARPSINIIINPSGFGPIFPDLVYTIKKAATGFAIVEEKTVTTDAATEPGFYQIQAITSSDSQVFDIFFSTNEKDKDTWAPLVKTILSTFRFTN
ncbi:MAG: hypothetical protein WCV85_02315 [Patescibacteria group bacterium]|jgi:hypothetical protein